MLRALYDYALQKNLTPPAGYVGKSVKSYISLLGDGRFVGIELGGKQEVPAPDIGSLANGTDKSNVLLEKRSVVLPPEQSIKSKFFLQALISASEAEPRLEVCVQALENAELAGAIRNELDTNKIKGSDRITFKVDGISILAMPATMRWWQAYRKQFQTADPASTARCLITGEPTVPVMTTAKIQGLLAVGGHGSGDALISFDKPAFQSYGLKQAANAPVSEEAFAGVKAALDTLLAGAPILAGARLVHWYDRDISPKEDAIAEIVTGAFAMPDEEDDEDTPADIAQKERDARRKADALVTSIHTGEQTPSLASTSYHILLLSGVGGRVMIRRYERGNYAQLQERITHWNDDLRLINPSGTGLMKPCKLAARLMRLISYQKADAKLFERLGKELSGLTPTILHAILNNGALPDTVAVRAMAYIRSRMLDQEDESNTQLVPDGWACQWLKVWLIRRNRERSQEYMEQYNFSHSEPAFHSGGLMAVFAAVQKKAMPDVNVNVAERFFASAMQTPALVLGRLAQMSVHHFSKLEPWFVNYYNHLLQKISVSIGEKVPATLNLEQQSDFMLGYYQMCAYLEQERRMKAAASKERQEAKTTDIDGGENDGDQE